MKPTAIGATGLRKKFSGHVVLDGVDLRVPEGTVFSLLGPNGAGKTTAVRILSTLVAADGGTATVAGHDVAADPDGVRAAIGVTGQFSAVDKLLTGEENLRLMGELYRLPKDEVTRRTRTLLARFDLVDAAGTLTTTYSGGMTRRLDLAMTLIAEPRVIFLDEPTTGLDPRSRRGMWEIIEELVAGGVTVFLTTQYLEEADRIADRIAVLDQGRIVAEGTPAELKKRIPGGHVRLRFPDVGELESALRVLGTATPDVDALSMTVPNDGSRRALKELLDRLDDASVEVDALSVHTPDLDDVFFALTGRTTEQKAPLS